MNLKEYLNAHRNISLASLAAQIGCTYQTAYNVLIGKNTPSLRMAIAIEEFTKGEVKIRDLVNNKSRNPVCVEKDFGLMKILFNDK